MTNITPEYIKMCSKAMEIREKWEPKVGDLVWRLYSPLDAAKELLPESQELIIINYKSDIPQYYHSCTEDGQQRVFKINDSSEYFKVTSIFLPSQEQLQGMVESNNAYTLQESFFKWMEKNIYEEWLLRIRFSHKQLWLAFVMHELYKKIWDKNKEDWV